MLINTALDLSDRLEELLLAFGLVIEDTSAHRENNGDCLTWHFDLSDQWRVTLGVDEQRLVRLYLFDDSDIQNMQNPFDIKTDTWFETEMPIDTKELALFVNAVVANLKRGQS